MKDLIYTSLGIASILKEQLEKKQDDFNKAKDSGREQIEKLLKDAEERGKSEQERFKSELREIVRDAISELNLATKDDIEKCRK